MVLQFNVKSENSDNDFYRIPGSVNSKNIEKDNASRNHLRDVEDSIIKNSKLKKNKKNRNKEEKNKNKEEIQLNEEESEDEEKPKKKTNKKRNGEIKDK